jgi:hypothetical protein
MELYGQSIYRSIITAWSLKFFLLLANKPWILTAEAGNATVTFFERLILFSNSTVAASTIPSIVKPLVSRYASSSSLSLRCFSKAWLR